MDDPCLISSCRRATGGCGIRGRDMLPLGGRSATPLLIRTLADDSRVEEPKVARGLECRLELSWEPKEDSTGLHSSVTVPSLGFGAGNRSALENDEDLAVFLRESCCVPIDPSDRYEPGATLTGVPLREAAE
mmetsp:Transcript_49377/g.92296  ORF Transcript_49377/g.92296 Transcript_49377/m.92296 type:complete len:132 (-) Transcript_49377:578-973(-)